MLFRRWNVYRARAPACFRRFRCGQQSSQKRKEDIVGEISQFIFFLLRLARYFQSKWMRWHRLLLLLDVVVGICSVSFDFQTRTKKRIHTTHEKKTDVRTRCENAVIEKRSERDETKQKRTVPIIFSKEKIRQEKEATYSVFARFVRVYKWWLNFFSFISAFL